MAMLTIFSGSRTWRAAALAVLLAATTAGPALAQDDGDPIDPPERVARLSFLGGAVSFQPAGGNEWVQASLNRPLMTGDLLHTDRNARTELQLGGATARIDDRTSINLLNLNNDFAQFELSEGVLSLSVRSLAQGQSYEVDTPTLAFVTTLPGRYRIDIAPDGSSTMVTVFDGGAEVYGENNASYRVRAGNSYRFHDSALRDYEVLDLPRADDFDNWVASRDRAYSRSVSRQYVSDDMIGAYDLDAYGSWSTVREYGAVWYPTRVAVGWAPYRSGYWSWIGPWGWTWIDSAPWGFAPFHYGRWVYIGNRWGWCPGPRHVRAFYAPAMVAFVGGHGWSASVSLGGPIGWFPLGPRDVYVPWYHTSHRYFTNINVHNTTIINNVHITNIYNDYSRGRPVPGNNYMWRNNTAALTAVSRDTFVGARPVMTGQVRVNARQWNDAAVVSRLGVAPTQASFVSATARRSDARPQAAVLERQIVARTAPPPRVAPISERIQAIERNGGQPLARPVATGSADRGDVATDQRGVAGRVRVVGNPEVQPQPLTRGTATTGAQRGADPSARGGSNADRGSIAPERGSRAPSTDSLAPPRGSTTPGARGDSRGSMPGNERALPSSRFAPARGGGTDQPVTAPAQRGGSRTIERSGTSGSDVAPSRGVQEPSREGDRPALRSRSYAPAPEQREYSQPATRSRSYEAPQQQRSMEQPTVRSRSYAPAPEQREYSQPATRSRSYAPAPEQREYSQPATRSRSYEAPQQQRSMEQPAMRARSYEAPPPQRSMEQPAAPSRSYEAPREVRQAAPARESAPARPSRHEDSDGGRRGFERH